MDECESLPPSATTAATRAATCASLLTFLCAFVSRVWEFLSPVAAFAAAEAAWVWE